MGALRYFLLRFARNTVIAFDFKEALNFDGETGPYVQYAVVRANNIFRKLADSGEEPPDLQKSCPGFGEFLAGEIAGAGATLQICLFTGAKIQPLLS